MSDNAVLQRQITAVRTALILAGHELSQIKVGTEPDEFEILAAALLSRCKQANLRMDDMSLTMTRAVLVGFAEDIVNQVGLARLTVDSATLGAMHLIDKGPDLGDYVSRIERSIAIAASLLTEISATLDTIDLYRFPARVPA